MKLLQKTSANLLPDYFAWGLIALACVAFFFFLFGIEIAVFALLGICIAWWTYEYPEEGFLTHYTFSSSAPSKGNANTWKCNTY